MTCTHCHRDIPDQGTYCMFCGRRQGASASIFPKPLRRSQVDCRLAGVCGGIARYLGTDPVFIRVVWIILTIVPGTILLGMLAYLVAWIIVPEAEPGTEPIDVGAKRLHRSADNLTVAGICGGIAEYFTVDVTAVRVVWILLSIFPGFVVFGLLAYATAWFIMPAAAVIPATAPPSTPPPAPSPDPARQSGASRQSGIGVAARRRRRLRLRSPSRRSGRRGAPPERSSRGHRRQRAGPALCSTAT